MLIASRCNMPSHLDHFPKPLLTWIGDDGLTEYKWRVDKPRGKKQDNKEESQLADLLLDRFRIYYPTRETIIASKGSRGVSTRLVLIAEKLWTGCIGLSTL